MKRGKPMKRTPMKKRPPRRGAMPTEVRAKVMARNGGRCEAGLKGVCTGAAEEFHHRRPVGVGSNPHTVGNGAALCHACHDFITFVSPAEGRNRGLCVSRHYSGDPGDKPMLVRHRAFFQWSLLTEEGGYEPWKGDE